MLSNPDGALEALADSAWPQMAGSSHAQLQLFISLLTDICRDKVTHPALLVHTIPQPTSVLLQEQSTSVTCASHQTLIPKHYTFTEGGLILAESSSHVLHRKSLRKRCRPCSLQRTSSCEPARLHPASTPG